MERKLYDRAGKIRSLNPATDLNAIADLIELCFKDTIDDDGLDYIRYLRNLANDTNSLYWGLGRIQHSYAPIQGFVYEIDGRIVGNLSMLPFHKNGDFIYLIANVAVHPDFRRHRIAFDLTSRSLKFAKEKSARSTWLQVRDDNPPAIELYKQMGFVERYRRSTYTIKTKSCLTDIKIYDVKVAGRKDIEWRSHQQLLKDIYPLEIRWNIGLRENRFLPGFWNSLSRFFSGITISNVSVFKDNQVIGFASLERTNLFADNLWIVSPEEYDDDVIRAVVPYFRNSYFTTRPQSVNYPGNRGAKSFIDLGFEKNHTLIWMEEKVDLTEFLTV
ncbi:MAG: GNAT family N-acetyltransferase [Anaerolineaceae bacterium]|nr:GNAT family N-acetyltransferase [Anaerolineaceae bacterium]